jgi:hypothetical protein
MEAFLHNRPLCETINPNGFFLSHKLQVFVAKRDRQALISYKANLHPQSEDYFYAENSLRVTVSISFNINIITVKCNYYDFNENKRKHDDCVNILIQMHVFTWNWDWDQETKQSCFNTQPKNIGQLSVLY